MIEIAWLFFFIGSLDSRVCCLFVYFIHSFLLNFCLPIITKVDMFLYVHSSDFQGKWFFPRHCCTNEAFNLIYLWTKDSCIPNTISYFCLFKIISHAHHHSQISISKIQNDSRESECESESERGEKYTFRLCCFFPCWFYLFWIVLFVISFFYRDDSTNFTKFWSIFCEPMFLCKNLLR